MIIVRQIVKSEIDQLQDFPPDDWNLDLPRLFSYHFGQSYFYPAVAEADGKIIGCGIGIIHGAVSWLGTIIVLPEFRRQGIGKKITVNLIDYCRSKGCTTHLLTASEMGEPLYRTLGFITDATYVFYKKESSGPARDISSVRELREEDVPSVRVLDRAVSGEDRIQLIDRFVSSGWVYTTKAGLKGLYLPDFGGGLIIARTADAGIELMKLRLNRGKTTAVVPEANSLARQYLLSKDFMIPGGLRAWSWVKTYIGSPPCCIIERQGIADESSTVQEACSLKVWLPSSPAMFTHLLSYFIRRSFFVSENEPARNL